MKTASSTSSVVLFILIRLVSTAANSKNLTLIGCKLADLKNEEIHDAAELYAVHCYLPELENAIFLRFNQLTVLEMSDSKISTLQDYALNGLTNLKVLGLARNNISQVKSWSNSDMISLVSLDLRRNGIRRVYGESFRRFPNLQKLNLAGNFIENIPYGVFRTMPHLKYINIGNNLLKRIDLYTFRGLHKLSTIALNCNRIESINPLAFETNNNVRSLRLETNDLTSLDFMLQMNLARLIHLNVSNNAIDSLRRLIFSNAYDLKSLDVSYNLIEEINYDMLTGLESLEMFNASHNQIHTIAAKSFFDLTSLTHLDISANNLTSLPVSIFNASHRLRHINMSDNALEHLDSNHFHEMEQLQLLDLSINHLHRDNFIEGLLLGHRSPSALLQLDLSNNMYSVLNLSLLYEFARVDLSGNLWDCKWLIQEMIRGPSTIHFGRNYTVKDTEDVLSVPGVDCFDEETERSIIVLMGGGGSSGWNVAAKVEAPNCPPKMVFWSKLRLNRFDDKEIVIWILIAVIVGFVLIRVGQILLARYVFSAKRNEKVPTTEDIEKMEMISYGDETVSVASTMDEIEAKPNKSK